MDTEDIIVSSTSSPLGLLSVGNCLLVEWLSPVVNLDKIYHSYSAINSTNHMKWTYIQTTVKSGLVWILNGQKEAGLKTVRISGIQMVGLVHRT